MLRTSIDHSTRYTFQDVNLKFLDCRDSSPSWAHRQNSQKSTVLIVDSWVSPSCSPSGENGASWECRVPKLRWAAHAGSVSALQAWPLC